MKVLSYVEIDIDYCSLTYGTAPCTASIPTTGAIKCFNSLKTCQDRANFDNEPATLRFTQATEYLPKDIPAIPSIQSISFSPAIVSLGQDLGQRASISITFRDHPHSDAGAGFDKYLADRPYDPFRQGTFWGKFRARQPYMTGRPLRLIRGLLGQTLGEMDTRHYIIESFDGPTPDGAYTITAKDVLKLADGDRAQAPRPSNGFLSGTIDSDDTAATLSPSGIGDDEYPASGCVNIGGKEICAFTRSGNSLTLTRAQWNTEAASHAGGERVQLCLEYSAETPAFILEDLLTEYADVDASYITLSEWETEVASYLNRLLTARIAEPTPVETLCSEIIEQAALALWWDDVAQKLRLKVIRPVPASADVFSRDNVLQGSLQSQEQPDNRVSSVLTFFGLRNPLEGVEDTANYLSSVYTPNLDAIEEYGSDKLKIIYSRWIPFGGLTVAERQAGLLLGRFRDPPRRFNLELFKYGNVTPVLGSGYQLEALELQDATGAQEQVPIQITSLNPGSDKYEVEAEEMRFDDAFLEDDDINNRVITIDVAQNNVNLRTIHDTLYPAPTEGDAATVTVTCIVESEVVVGSTTIATPAFNMGSWPTGWDQDNLILVVNGRLQGCGGVGGAGGASTSSGGSAGGAGGAGGTALYTRVSVTVDNNGEIWGGGGGGGGGAGRTRFIEFSDDYTAGGGGGGGGRGTLGGNGGGGGSASGSRAAPGGGGNSGSASAAGTAGNGGNSSGIVAGGNGGAGGDAGSAGSAGSSTSSGGGFGGASGGAGGAAGAAVDGHSYVTYDSTGSRLGGLVN